MADNVFAQKKRVIRSEPNEYDKATVVSIYPKDVSDVKHTIFPGTFEIKAGSVDKPTILILGPSSWFRDMGDDQPSVEIPNNAVQVAASFVTDYCNGLLMYDKAAGPGLFFIPGLWTLKDIQEKFKKEFMNAVTRQNAWYKRLLDLADHGWAVTNGSPKAISDLMRLAATELGQTNRDWMKSTILENLIKCVACGSLRNPDFPICGTCNRIVDSKLAKERGILELTSK